MHCPPHVRASIASTSLNGCDARGATTKADTMLHKQAQTTNRNTMSERRRKRKIDENLFGRLPQTRSRTALRMDAHHRRRDTTCKQHTTPHPTTPDQSR
jgi:hypothetical protein